jgi:enediyne biosynthesis protein E4
VPTKGPRAELSAEPAPGPPLRSPGVTREARARSVGPGSRTEGRADRFLGLIVVAVVFGSGYAVQAWRSGDLPLESLAPAITHRAPPKPTEIDLVDATASSGIDHVHHRLIVHPSLRHIENYLTASGGAAVAVVDFDRDGNQDVYLTSMGVGTPNRLFRNNGDGTYTDVAPAAGLADVNDHAGSLRALFFDFENDGDPDLVLTTTYCPKVFRNEGDGTFTDVTTSAGIQHCGFAVASNVTDLDGDGDLDLIIADFWRSVDFLAPTAYDFLPETSTTATNGGPINVYYNQGDGTFTHVPDALGIHTTGFAHAIGVYDLDGSGRSDLYFANDFNYADGLYLSDGQGGLRDASSLLDQKYSSSAMNAEIADFRNMDRPAVFVTHIHEPGWLPSRNVFWQIRNDGTFVDRAAEVGIARCGWAWGGKFADLDNDGWQDLAVANGFFTGTTNRSYWFKLSVMSSGHSFIATDARSWPPIDGASMSGGQRSCLFRNVRGTFADITDGTAFGADRSNGRGVAVIDERNDGHLSLVVANYDQPARLYRNALRNANHWIGFELLGTRSGTDAYGTKITLRTADGLVQTREKEPANGYLSQSDPRIHFGLGHVAEITEATVRWPSGAEQKLSGLEPDRYIRLTEPTEP